MSTEPQSTEPKSTEPQSTEPKSTEPKSTEPQSTEPQSTEHVTSLDAWEQASTPVIGQVVHYTARGSADGVYQPVCRAALITETASTATDQRIGLAVINPTGLFFHALAADDDRDHRGGCPYDPDRRPGSWHWPADCHDTHTASFAGVTLIDESLPERLRDIAANLLSESTRERASVTDGELEKLGSGDAADLLRHIGRTLRDQPAKQKAGVNAIFRILRSQPGVVSDARDALLMLPPSDITLATPLQFKRDDPAEIRSVLTTWKERLPEGPVKRAIESALNPQGGA